MVKASGGELRSTAKIAGFERVETDSRADLKQSLFVALKGDRFDGHDFVIKALESGAAGALVHQWRPEFEEWRGKSALIVVGDTLKGLQKIAAEWRTKCGFRVVGITGSNGKTTTKELALQLLKNKFKTSASPGSFNNHWGVPLSLLMANPDHQVVLQEMGMNHRGEIATLCGIAKPDVVVVTTVGTAHIGELGSIAAIKEAKAEIYENAPGALRIYNLDNEHTLSLYETAMKGGFPKERAITFSSYNQNAHIFLRAGKVGAEGIEITGKIFGVSGAQQIKAFGRQTVINLMAACGVALALRMDPKDIFAQMPRIHLESWGRNQWLSPNNGPSIIFDGYNANPDSMRMLLKNLYELEVSGEKVFVFGDMRELGEQGPDLHGEIAELAGQIGFSTIWYMGAFTEAVSAGVKKTGFRGELILSKDFDDQTAKKLYGTLHPGDVVALKASRGSRIERVLNSWGVDGF